MRKILIFRDVSSATYNINMTEDEFISDIDEKLGSNCPNMGNKIWFWGLISEIDTSYIQISFYKKEYTIDYINENFDGIILPDANLFGLPFEKYIDSNTLAFQKIKIPIYIISVGLQIDQYDEMDEVVKRLGYKVKRMIDLVYSSGGAVCVRGNITAEFLDKCGTHEVFVGGCPSLYQFGSDLKINKKEQTRDCFKVAVNGHIDNLYGTYYKSIFDRYKKSEYFCQDEFYRYLFGSGRVDDAKNSYSKDIQLIKSVGICGAELLQHNKVNLFCNPYEWIKYISDNDFSMSFGSRIHGNIASLLAGVPALLHVRDLRTLDIADYYGFPRIFDEELKKKDIFSLYEKLDFTKFNKNYTDIYRKFQEFLISCDLVENINENNKFKCSYSLKQDKDDIQPLRYRNKFKYELADNVFYMYRKYVKGMKI